MTDYPNFSLRGQVALVTGASQGIGFGLAKALALGKLLMPSLTNLPRTVLFVGLPITLGMICSCLLFARLMAAESYIDGVVVDSVTGQPLSGVRVAVSNRGWAVVDGGLIWDKDYVYPTLTDAAGQFTIAYRVGSSAHVIATKANYIEYNDWHDSNTSIVIRLQMDTGASPR